ncbi:hypothetical protein R6Q59_025531 [Mikania micrantha]
MASIEFHNTFLDWMKQQDKQFVETFSGASGIILSRSVISSGSKDGSVDLQKLPLPEFSGFQPPRDVQKENLTLDINSTPDALTTNVEERILSNPSNTYVFHYGDPLQLFEATHIWGQVISKPGWVTSIL